MTKVLNFGLKIKGVVGRVAHAKSSDPATPQNLKRAPGGRALECNLTGKFPFFKNLHNPFRKKMHFRYPVSELFDYKKLRKQ